MEIRDLELVMDDKVICTFTIYINESKLSLLACQRKGKKPGSKYISPYVRSFPMEDGSLFYKPNWQFDKEYEVKFLEEANALLKEAMNKAPDPRYQQNVPL